MKFLKLFSAISFFALSTKAGFWDNVERTELYEMIEKSIPEMRISLPNDTWNEMVQKAQITKQTQNTDYEVEANMKFIYEGNEEEYTINFKLGGKSSPEFSKPGYNIKIKGNNQNLHGTKNFRLRSDQREASMMRSKITTDILQKSGLIAVEVGYTELYVNDEYMGFWVISDSIKNKWIKRKFGDENEDIKTLYQCKNDGIRFNDNSAKKKCVNANDEYADYMEPFNNFVDQVNAATTREDLEKIMDVDNFMKYMAWEWLMGTWDHFLGPYGHNLYWYQQPNGKWVYIPYDHDIELGQDLWTSFFKNKPYNRGGDIDFSNVSFKDFELDHPIIKILVHNDDTKFRELVGDIISKVFNPDTILSHIDDIKEIISPYVKKDRESNAGKINKVGKEMGYTYEHFLLNSEYTYIHNTGAGFRGYGLKDWIRRRYNFAAAYYGINTNASSPEEKHKLIEPRPEPVILPYKVKIITNKIDKKFSYLTMESPLPNYTPDRNYSDDRVPVLGVNQYNLERKSSNTTTNEPSEQCWSEVLGYKCCSKGCNARIILVDESGYWGAENGEWCGIPKCEFENDECPGKKYGYSCCQKCDVFLTDNDGAWGVENNDWCSIKDSSF